MEITNFFSKKWRDKFLGKERSVESKGKFIALNLLIAIALITVSGGLLFLWCLAIGQWGYSPAGIVITIVAIGYFIMAVIFFELFEKYHRSFCLRKDKLFMQVSKKGEVISVGRGKMRISNSRTVELRGNCLANLANSRFVHSLKIKTSISRNIKGKHWGIKMEIRFAISLFSSGLINSQVLWDYIISRNIADDDSFSMEEYIQEIINNSFTEEDARRLMDEEDFSAEEERLGKKIGKKISPAFSYCNRLTIQDFSTLRFHSA